MAVHPQREIEELKRSILHLSVVVEESVENAVRAIENRDGNLAGAVIAKDSVVDRMEVQLEDDCLKALADCPEADGEMRFIIAILKINSDLERIGDLAVNIAERAQFLSTREAMVFPFDLSRMAAAVGAMLQSSLNAFVSGDGRLALSVCAQDDDVDAMHRDMYTKVQAAILDRPDQIAALTRFISVSHDLERIADHATNISEDVIYMLTGNIVRHRAREYRTERRPQPAQTIN